MPRCVAVFCGNTGDAGLGMFSFPKDPELNLVWRQNMKRTKSAREPNKLWENTVHSKLCGAHFDESCFQKVGPEREKLLGWKPGKRALVQGAIPTIFKRSVNDPLRKTKPVRSAFMKRERKEAIKQILQEYDAKEMGTSTVQLLQDDMLEKPEEQPPMSTDGHDVTATASLNQPLPILQCVPLPLTDIQVMTQSPPPEKTSCQNSSGKENTLEKPPKLYHKKMQTPARWAPKPPAAIRSYATQAGPTMVDKGTQYDPPEEENQPTKPVPSVFEPVEEDLDTSFRSESTMDMDDDSDDPDYEPELEMEVGDDDDSEDESRGTYLQPEEDVKKETKYLVFESALIELLNVCRVCGAKANVRKNFIRGTFIELESLCTISEDHRQVWRNQPVHNSLPIGNLLLAGSILFSGSSPVKVVNMLKFLRVATFCLRTFFRLQKAYLLPAINSVWFDAQTKVLAEVSGPLKLGGDARCCSPGHTAKYGSYTLMDLQTSKVVDMQLIQSNEVANSNAMELEGLKRCLQTLEGEDVSISDITTDRHPQVKKFMREQHPEINHWFDVWHVAKGVKKKVEAAGKRKGCAILCDWSQSISNHLYFCAASSGGDGELLEQKWCSLLNHVVDIHEGHGSRYPKCQHGQLDDRAWIKKGSKPHKELKDVIERKLLLKDIKKLSPSEQTYGLESFHKICCFFATKFVHFFYQSMEGRLQLACLHFNENSNRMQDVTKDGEAQWQVSVPKYKQGAPVAKQVKVAATYNYVDKLMDEVMSRREDLPSVQKSLDDIQPMLARTPRPVCTKYGRYDKKEVVSAHKSRFNLAANKLKDSA